jgi:hypothetical protein
MTQTSTPTTADLLAVVAELPRTAESHPQVEWDGKGCQVCGKNGNAKAHTSFHKAARDAQNALLGR